MKKILALLLSVVMAVSLFAACAPTDANPTDAPKDPTEAPTQAPTEAPGPAADKCLCGKATTNGDASNCIGDCDGTWLVWTELTQTMLNDLTPAEGKVVLPDGNYRLAADVMLIENGLLVNNTIVIDLNGHSFTLNTTTDSVSVFYIAATGNLTVVDSAEGGKVVPSVLVNTKGGIVSNGNGGKFNLYGGTLDGSAINNGQEGPVVWCKGGSFMNMFGGTVIGGNTSNYGGAVYINGGSNFKMTGGEIYGGKAGQLGNNLYIGKNNGTVVELLGGTVYGGVATSVPIIKVGGDLKVLATEKDGSAVSAIKFRDPGAYVYVENLSAGASIAFDVYESGKVAQGVTEADIGYFVAPAGYKYVVQNGDLVQVTQ